MVIIQQIFGLFVVVFIGVVRRQDDPGSILDKTDGVIQVATINSLSVIEEVYMWYRIRRYKRRMGKYSTYKDFLS